MNRLLRGRLSLVVLLIVTFVSGGLAGAAGDRLLHADEAPRRHGDRDKRHDMDQLLDGLDLTAEQRGQVERVLERHRPRVEAIWASCKPRIAAQIDSTNAEIRVLLTPAQQEAFDREIREREARHRNRHRASGEGR